MPWGFNLPQPASLRFAWLRSGDDEILRQMDRGYTAERYRPYRMPLWKISVDPSGCDIQKAIQNGHLQWIYPLKYHDTLWL